MPLYRPFPRSPPPLSLAPALSVFFPAGGCPFLSLSPSDSEPIVARGISPLVTPPLFPPSNYPSLFLAFSFLLAPASLLLFLLRYLSTLPPSATAVPPLPRADAAARCNVTFIVSFSSFPLVFLNRLLSTLLSYLALLSLSFSVSPSFIRSLARYFSVSVPYRAVVR